MKTCSFFGHRNTVEDPELKNRLGELIRFLITEKGVRRFLFGSASRFDEICLRVVTEIQKECVGIQRVCVRAQYPCITKKYEEYLLSIYDECIIPANIECAGKGVYVKRNQEMINASDYCIFYYNEEYLPPKRKQSKKGFGEYQPKSGTRIAYEYACQRKRVGKLEEVFNIFNK